jgi:biopolymer transport protein ExbB
MHKPQWKNSKNGWRVEIYHQLNNNVNHYHLHYVNSMSNKYAIHSEIIELYSLILDSGGPVMMVLISMSVIGSCVITLKILQFYLVRIGAFSNLQQAVSHYSHGQMVEAETLLKQSRNPVAKILYTVMDGQQSGLSESLLREEAQRLGTLAIADLRAHLRILEVIASLAPLLGLLGTVLGIIDAFHQMEMAGSQVDVSLLSGGIWVALLTTAAGLAIGIPAVAAVNWIESRIERFTLRTEDLVTQLFTLPILVQRQQEASCELTQQLAGQGA